MRNKHATASASLAGLILLTTAALAGCSGSGSSSASSSGAFSAASLPSAAAAAEAPAAAGGAAQADSTTRFVPNTRQLIYTAQLTVRAGNVAATVSRATSIVTAAGGYVSAENASGGPGQPAAKASAIVTLKIPAAAYTATLARLAGTGLGTQLDLSQQTQDVTQQVADVGSRVASDEAAITQLRALLKHAGTVGDLLSVQDQINAEESDLEAMQAQQSALNHETSYATVTLTILGPKAAPAPVRQARTPGLSNGLVAGWHAFRTTASWLLAIIGAVAPFAAIIALIGGLAYWARRWFTRRGRQPGSSPADSPADS